MGVPLQVNAGTGTVSRLLPVYPHSWQPLLLPVLYSMSSQQPLQTLVNLWLYTTIPFQENHLCRRSSLYFSTACLMFIIFIVCSVPYFSKKTFPTISNWAAFVAVPRFQSSHPSRSPYKSALQSMMKEQFMYFTVPSVFCPSFFMISLT